MTARSPLIAIPQSPHATVTYGEHGSLAVTPPKQSINLGVLCSHGGSGLDSIIKAIANGKLDANVCIVVSNNSKAYVLKRAHKHGIATRHISAKTDSNPDEAIKAVFKEHQVQLIVCAGYMRLVGTPLLETWPGRIINIHPALIGEFPQFGGMGMYGLRVHEAVLKEKQKTSGATVHLVTGKYDQGRILDTESAAISSKDTPEALQEKVKKIEQRLYPKALQDYIQKEFPVSVKSSGKEYRAYQSS